MVSCWLLPIRSPWGLGSGSCFTLPPASMQSSRVQDASLVTCRSLRTPPALTGLTLSPCSFRLHARYNAGQSGTAFRSDTSSKGLRPHPTYNIPCARFTSLVRLSRSSHRSVRGATLGNGGWLTLSMPGLSTGQMRFACVVHIRPGSAAAGPQSGSDVRGSTLFGGICTPG